MGKSVELSVGTIFKVLEYENRTDVVINTGEKNWFFAAECSVENGILSIISGTGTAGPENISGIIQRFPTKIVKEKMIKYWEEIIGHQLDEDFLKTINREVSGKTRRINLE